jgi:hypothetical protein
MTLVDILEQAKWTFATRRVDRSRVVDTDTDFAAVIPGDLILAHVGRLGQHRRVQLPSGRPSLIFPGDAVVMACGARYAPDQFEGLAQIDPAGADLLAGGGCIGRMGAIKATGTAAFGDFNEYTDSGAHYVGDFTDAGMVTTYLEPLDRIKSATGALIAEAGHRGCDVVVMEVADGILQRETSRLIADPWFAQLITGLVFACGDPVAAAGGVAHLARLGLMPDALTGMLSCSPMASAEARAVTGVPVLTRDDLSDPAEATGFALRAGLGRKEAA